MCVTDVAIFNLNDLKLQKSSRETTHSLLLHSITQQFAHIGISAFVSFSE